MARAVDISRSSVISMTICSYNWLLLFVGIGNVSIIHYCFV